MPPEAGNAGWWAGSQAEPGRDKQRLAARQSQAVDRARQPGTVRHQSDQRRLEPGPASQQAEPDSQANSQTARQADPDSQRARQTQAEPDSQPARPITESSAAQRGQSHKV